MPTMTIPTAAGPVAAVVPVPGSKSLSNRALVCAALADGDSVVSSIAPGDDTAAMLDCLGRLGVATHADAGAGGDTVRVSGTGGVFRPGPITLPTRLAGTTSRFVTAVASLGDGPYTVDGEPPLRRRPMAPLHDALAALGATVTPTGAAGHLPVVVGGPPRGGTVAVPGSVSSQYVTALMLIGPLLADGVRIDLVGRLVSRPYVEITTAVMETFGASGVEVTDDRVTVPSGRYVSTGFTVEPDASSASYPLALAAVAGGSVTVPGLSSGSLQGDARFAALLGEMGCDVTSAAGGITVTRHRGTALAGIDVDMADISDLVPTLAVVAALASSPTRIRGVGFIRGKESDRLGDLAAELTRTGARVAVTDDGLDIEPAELHGARLGTHHDHRLAMAFGVLGAAVPGVVVDDPDVVTKSWPAFWEMLSSVTAAPGRPPGPPDPAGP